MFDTAAKRELAFQRMCGIGDAAKIHKKLGELIGEMTPWIRVLSPHAGPNQGIQFIPEIGDQVLVDFEGGDAESPYVVGSLYHAGHTPDNAWSRRRRCYLHPLVFHRP